MTKHNSVKDLPALTKLKFSSAEVKEGIWIMYAKKYYNDELCGGTTDDFKIIEKGVDPHDIRKHNGSMYLLSENTSALTLFKHAYYGGVHPDPKAYVEDSYFDITNDFPTDNDRGASSGIVGNGVPGWKLFTQTSFLGPSHELTRGERAHDFKSIGVNDQVKSLRKV